MRANDALFPFILDLALGNPAKYGLRRPQQGILQQIAESAKIPVLDVGTTRKIAQGAIKIMPGLSAITEDGAVFEGGNKAKFDAIIFATGYRPNYRDFLEDDDISAASDGMPNEQTPISTVHFVGFRSPVSGLLRELSKEAVRIAGHIVGQRKELAVSRA
jgi:Flavin-binding monooxygenase-like